MEQYLQIEIVTKSGAEFKKKAIRLIAEGVDGDVEILTEHAHFLTFLKEGKLILDEINEDITNEVTYSCGEGLLEVMENSVRLLVDYVKSPN